MVIWCAKPKGEALACGASYREIVTPRTPMKIDYRKKCEICGKKGKANACIIYSYIWYDTNDSGGGYLMLRKIVTYRKGFTLEK